MNRRISSAEITGVFRADGAATMMMIVVTVLMRRVVSLENALMPRRGKILPYFIRGYHGFVRYTVV